MERPGKGRQAKHGQELSDVMIRVFGEDLPLGGLCVAALNRVREVMQVCAGLRDDREISPGPVSRIDRRYAIPGECFSSSSRASQLSRRCSCR